jgi:hypothetical protein
MRNERTEAQILAKEPLTLKFGTADYQVKILGFKKAEAWRKHAVDTVKSIVAVHRTECDSNDAFTHGLAFFFLQFPQKMLDLILFYAGDEIPRQAVEDEATDEQISVAFGQIIAIAFPFTKELGMISHVMGIATSFPQSAKSSR